MDMQSSPPDKQKSLLKRWLPFFIIAAIAINLNILAIVIDLINIVVIGLGFSGPVRPVPVNAVTDMRTYGNIALLAAILVVALRDLREASVK